MEKKSGNRDAMIDKPIGISPQTNPDMEYQKLFSVMKEYLSNSPDHILAAGSHAGGKNIGETTQTEVWCTHAEENGILTSVRMGQIVDTVVDSRRIFTTNGFNGCGLFLQRLPNGNFRIGHLTAESLSKQINILRTLDPKQVLLILPNLNEFNEISGDNVFKYEPATRHYDGAVAGSVEAANPYITTVTINVEQVGDEFLCNFVGFERTDKRTNHTSYYPDPIAGTFTINK